ncbi:barstar family protein [Ornithinimicrobium cavernae]|uniref:barstar family protein n=1 Tax=Ornithinimicrobium cavernae TaxID=2666047 RepID=UPI000D685CA6|nr:barstar family protein [Ornithinimicrobium cavernae]
MSAPTRVTTVLPGLRGRGVVLAAPADVDRVRHALTSAGFTLAEADLTTGGHPDVSPVRPPGAAGSADHLDGDPPATSLRTAQRAVATALRLPETAGSNLDALVDSLRDLATWWPRSERIVLVLHGAAALVDSDLPGWHTLTEILHGASEDLWRGGAPGDRLFETVALVERHGVLALPEEPT